jgi:hypothetical protein
LRGIDPRRAHDQVRPVRGPYQLRAGKSGWAAYLRRIVLVLVGEMTAFLESTAPSAALISVVFWDAAERRKYPRCM